MRCPRSMTVLTRRSSSTRDEMILVSALGSARYIKTESRSIFFVYGWAQMTVPRTPLTSHGGGGGKV